ncbi:EAL domain-containing protein [Vibrio sp. Isolate31]|uniref:EAL domain-containing protein n=1 Tax=unclassified Vibrio TaxID=2614977 RepID=UPI001EFE86AD|nr:MULTISPECIES: EAL domain-containing protein [unclassified Vibrio]MCG9554075.1 EAL domain-containing protein [Vibrio sp. Isolate32]MCG9602269.1 EAL domain-containing protein [Vibrio sp. Isolate31]
MSQKEMERDLRHAINKQQFEIHYLPKWALKSGDVEVFEALVRWNHPIKGLMYPNDFIPVAEATGQIRQIDLLVAELALAQHKNWLTRGIDIGVMSLNISARSLKHPQFFDALKRMIISSGVATHKIEVEITETVMIENGHFAQVIFKELHQLGVRIALDDFGTGFSSLSYLKEFEFNTLKIDRSFVMDYITNPTSLVLLKSMTQIGHELGVPIIAGGVETLQKQRDLIAMGYEIGQGFYLTSPQTTERLIENLQLNSVFNVVPMSGNLG